jgi:RHS repeat-associated protein
VIYESAIDELTDRRATMTLPNQIVALYGYDSASRLTSISYSKGGSSLGDLTYQYDAAGQITGIGGSLARTSVPDAVASASYNSANHQTSFSGSTLSYDLNGNLTSDGVNTYTWNARDQLVSMSGPGLSASFQYDAVGRRVGKTVNSATTTYLHDGWQVVSEQTSGSAVSYLSAGLDEIVARSDSAGTTYPLVDALSSAMALTDAAGAVQTSYTYEPFGKATASGASSTNTSKYTAREDDQTGLYYYRARYYSPRLQRFISEDPIGIAGGINLYAYVGNNPVSYSDPFGLKEKDNPFWDPYGLFSGPTACKWLGRIGSACAGFGDTVSGGLTDKARDATGANSAVDKNTAWYAGGKYAGYAWEAATAFSGAASIASNFVVRTPYGLAFQSLSREALAARRAINGGATMYRGGVLGRSAAAEGQFWALESPLNLGYAQRYGIPAVNSAFDFVLSGVIKPGAKYITRRAPGIGSNAGGGVEVVVRSGGVNSRSFFMP